MSPRVRRAEPVVPSKPQREVRPGRTAPADTFRTGSSGRRIRVSVGRSGELEVASRRGRDALIALARGIEGGSSPFRELTRPQQERLFHALAKSLTASGGKKPKATDVLERSAAATALLSLAGTASAELRSRALATYVEAMSDERVQGLRYSMLVNLDASHLSLEGGAFARVAKVREQLLPRRPPNELRNVRHYVMEDFWRSEVAAYKRRGFTLVKDEGDRVTFRKGERTVVVIKGHENVLRDIDDPKVDWIIYSGHAQLGGVVEQSLMTAAKEMKGEKLISLFSCRGKQTVGDILEQWPGAHVMATFSSSYGPDDIHVLDKAYETFEKGGDYADWYRSIVGSELIQPKANYILPHDARVLAYRDTDDDSLKDVSPVGPDRFYDPSRAFHRGGAMDLKPRPNGRDPQEISGEKIDHAVSYANTAFFYFAEENRAAPLTVPETDRFIARGWYQSDSDEPVRIERIRRDGETYWQVSFNSRYAHQNRNALAAMLLMEMQKQLVLEEKGRFDAIDRLRGLQLVGIYADLMVPFADDCDRLVKAVAERYGFTGVSWDVVSEAVYKDGDHGTATKKAIDYLKKHVQVVA